MERFAKGRIKKSNRKMRKLRARTNMILQRLECPCPTLYGEKQFKADISRLVYFSDNRQAKVALTADEDAEEAHLLARVDSFAAGPELAAEKRLRGLQDKQRAFRNGAGPRLTHKERVDLRLLRLLYPPPQSSFCYQPDDDPHYHPFRDEPLAEDGNLYPPNSRLRPAPPEEEDIDMPLYLVGNPNYPETSAGKSVKKFDLILNNRARHRDLLKSALRSRGET